MYGAGIYKQFSKGYLSTVHTQAHVDHFISVLEWATKAVLAEAD
jgi:hypothetical protein